MLNLGMKIDALFRKSVSKIGPTALALIAAFAWGIFAAAMAFPSPAIGIGSFVIAVGIIGYFKRL